MTHNLASQPRAFCRHIALKISRFGLKATINLGAKRFVERLRLSALLRHEEPDKFDLIHGTDTAGVVGVGALDVPTRDAMHAVRYQTALIGVFNQMLKDLPIVYEDFLFVDLGSGKGRALLLASHFPFKGILGVELSPTLHRIACKNIELYNNASQRCHQIESVCQNVIDYEVPNDNVVFYLFNPFDDQVIHIVLSKMEEAVKELRNKICIMYLKALHRQLFDGSPCFHVLKDSERYVIYESNAPSVSQPIATSSPDDPC